MTTTSPRARSVALVIAAASSALIGPRAADAVVLGFAADPNGNTNAPTGSLANSGWQYQGVFGAFFLGTPVGPHTFVTAAHLGGVVGTNTFLYNGVTYDTTSETSYGDLAVWSTSGTFYSYAPLYNAASAMSGGDGAEWTMTGGGKDLVVIGRGRVRGSEVRLPDSPGGTLHGWQWGTRDNVERWGENIVSGFDAFAVPNDLLKVDFDSSGAGFKGANEASLAEGDSGGAVFIKSGTQWKLAGINYGATSPYKYATGGDPFNAALFDTTGFLYGDGSVPEPTSIWYASRIASYYSTLAASLPPTWKPDGDANWTATTSWTTATVPNAVGAEADFRTVISADRTVTLNVAQTVGTVTFDNPVGNYTISGGGNLTLDVASGNTSINVASGNHTLALPMTLNDGLTINVIPAGSSLTLSGQMTAGSQPITKIGQGIADVKNLRAAAVNVSEGKLRVISNGTSAGTSKVTAIQVNTGNGAQLDLTNNDAVVEYSASSPRGSWTGSAYTGLQGLIAAGANNGAWTGPGITSSAAAATPGYTTLGIAEASEALGLIGSQTAVWSGQSVDSTSVLIGYTYAGDLNLDGIINGDDYFQIDSAFPQQLHGYYDGDINYDGVINGDDYFLIDSNFPAQGGQLITSSGAGTSAPALVGAVPEPGSILLAWMMSIGSLARRRRRR